MTHKINGNFLENCVKIKLIRRKNVSHVNVYFQEFHATAGSLIKCQVPENYISRDVFDLINVYILPKRELERQILTVNTLGIKIVGYPVK
jgi:Nitrogen permease regulator 2